MLHVDVLCVRCGRSRYLFWQWGHQGHYGGLVLGISPVPLAEFLAAWWPSNEPRGREAEETSG